MTEQAAREWIATRWDPARLALLDRYVDLLRAENMQQNLIARSTLDTLWHRHILDSAQLVPMATDAGAGDWIDIGSGAGLPGIVAAILQSRPVILIEPRRRRADFLEAVVQDLALNAVVIDTKSDAVRRAPASVVSARAVAPLDALFASAAGFTDLSTLWLLPKGRSAHSELADARLAWQGVFHVEQSLTADESQIVIAQKVQRR